MLSVIALACMEYLPEFPYHGCYIYIYIYIYMPWPVCSIALSWVLNAQSLVALACMEYFPVLPYPGCLSMLHAIGLACLKYLEVLPYPGCYMANFFFIHCCVIIVSIALSCLLYNPVISPSLLCNHRFHCLGLPPL